ncbi:serine hydrolase [Flavobacterium sp.]|uniref:serine hydrolase n=1 Tax=Flavobacterium sp. TaxID=239 RepID=UPI00286E09A8|nr:serine hydrolase [Flavobacterium sp.]
MKKLLLITFLFTITSTLFAQIPIDSIKKIIQKEVSNKRSKSMILGIVDANGTQTFSFGIKSDLNPQKPDGNTIYEIGSIGKIFTALSMAEMSLKNELNYNDPISKFLPKTVKTPTRNGKEISLLNLSTNRSGLPRMQFNLDPKNLDNPWADYTTTQLYEYISSVELNKDINSKWQYSNIGFGLLGHILSLTAQKDYETLVKQKICEPLNMKNTVVSFSPKQYPNVATGHSEYGKPVSGWSWGKNQTLAGSGALRSTVNDLLKFAAANLGLFKTNLSPAIELTHINQGKKDGNDGFVTMGWTIMSEDNLQILWKDGGTFGCRSFIGIDKKNKFGIVILSNSDNPVTDIGLHILDNSNDIKPYKYKWNLLDTLASTTKSKGVNDAIILYHKLKKENNSHFVFEPMQLNNLGNELRKENKIKEAIKIFELNATEYPSLPNVYESLAELYKRNGNKKLAITYFEKLVEMEPQNPRWTFLLNKLKTK